MGRSWSSCPDGEIPELVRRLGWRQGLAGGFANFDGAVFLFVYTSFLQPDLDGEHTNSLVEVGLFVAYVLVTGAFCGWRIYRSYRSATASLEEGREPTDQERDAILRFPLVQALTCVGPWIGAAVLFPILGLASGGTDREAMRLGMTIFLGGLVSTALAFLLVERTLRPLFALALDGQARTRNSTLGVRPRLLMTWGLASAVPLVAIAGLHFKHDGEDVDVTAAVVALAAAGLAAGLVATAVAARSVADPLDEVRAALARVEEGDLDVRVTVDDAGEVGRLQAGVNQMVEGLRERHRLADLFGRHVGTEVAQRALVEGAGLESETREASALFVDVVGSTAMAEVLPPQEVVRTLNAFFGAVVAAVSAEGGWVNKFEGDGALCVFGAPASQPDHAARALRAARDLRRRIEALSGSHPGLDAAIGVSSGAVVAGNVGTEQRYEYTIIGRPVNEAARLSELAKTRSGRALASAGAMERAGDEASNWSGLGSVALRGQHAPTAIYEPTDPVPANA